MNTPAVFVICGNNCKYEGMTKEQILSAIMQAVEYGKITNVDKGFITTLLTVNNVSIKFFYGEQAAYDALTEEQKENLYAIITNDTFKADVNKALEDLKTDLIDLQTTLENTRAFIPLMEDANGRYAIEVGKRYIVYCSTTGNVGAKKFTANLVVKDGSTYKTYSTPFGARSAYEKSLTLQVLGGVAGLNSNGENVYDFDYIYNETLGKTTHLYEGGAVNLQFLITNASKVILVNI